MAVQKGGVNGSPVKVGVCMNITLSLDENIVRKARKVAIDRNTTLTGMVRKFLEETARSDEMERKRAVLTLRETFSKYGRDMGQRSWRREALHDRPALS